jgi:hypothetical protein
VHIPYDPKLRGVESMTLYRLNQGPFTIDQDSGWRTITITTRSRGYVPNIGYGLIGYTWEENGPSLKARKGEESLEQHVENLASLPFVDVLYIRCDWRDVQNAPGKLALHPVWELTLDAARRYGCRVAFRVQLSNPNLQQNKLAIPDFLRDQVPLINVGRLRARKEDSFEPKYSDPAFQKAFSELNQLLAERFDGHPLVEFADLMMYGFWGEGHTAPLANPFPDYYTAESTCVAMASLQLSTWSKIPLVVNTQTDISRVGNAAVRELALANGAWLRSDSIIIEEPEQIETISGRPAWTAAIMEDGYYRHYRDSDIPVDGAGFSMLENAMLHVADLGANYWSLWTEADQIQRFFELHPDGYASLRERLGYRIRPSWIWQRKRFGTDEVVVAIANDGAAGVPGTLWLILESPEEEGRLSIRGHLDRGHPHGGRLRLASFVLPPGFDGKELLLRAEIEIRTGVRHPCLWSCAQPVCTNGALSIRLARHEDGGWRDGD